MKVSGTNNLVFPQFKTPLDEAPKGALCRGKYHAKCKFIDDDKTVHLAWEWTFKIQSDW